MASGEGQPSQSAPAGAGTGGGGRYRGSMSEYCKGLESWLWNAYWHRECAVSAYYSALSILHQQQNQQYFGGGAGAGAGGANANGGANGNLFDQMNNANFANGVNPQAQQQQPARGPTLIRQILIRGIRVNGNPLGIVDFSLAPVWKRVAAECIDFVILLIVKIFITVSIIDAFDLFDLDNIDLDALHDSEALLEMAYSLSLPQLLLLELTHRLTVCIFEAYCLAKGGATPGKNMMGLRVLYCETILPIGPNINNNQDYLYNGAIGGQGTRVIVAPGSLLTFQRAFLRSVIKNFSLAFFFPFCFTLFHFEYSRTLYDLSAKSIVVELPRM